MRPLRLCGETRDSARLIGETLEIHTLELGWYNLQESELATASREGLEIGREEGEIKLIQTLQEILGGPVSDAAVFKGRSLEQLRAMTEELRKKIQRRT